MQDRILRAQGDPWEMLGLLLENPIGCNYVNVCTVLHRCGRLTERHTPELRDALSRRLLPVVATVLPDCKVSWPH